MATFVLLHGAWHDASCWDQLIPELRERGHEGVAPALPSTTPKRRSRTAHARQSKRARTWRDR